MERHREIPREFILLAVCLHRPPPSLIRQEAEGTQLYLAILTLSTMENEADAIGKESNRLWKMGRKSPPSGSESEKLKQEAERRLVAFYGLFLREMITLQSRPGETLPTDVYKSLSLRAPVTIKVEFMLKIILPQIC